MTEWIFQGGKEEFRIRIEKGLAFLKSKITNFEWLPFKERLFRDREQRKNCYLMNLKIPKLNRDELHVYIITQVLYGKFTQCYKYYGCIEDGKFIPGEEENKQKQIKNGYSPIRE